MSRYREWDGGEYDTMAILNAGRWEHNARRALKGKRGRKALAMLREALMALPEHRLIDDGVCTVGGVDRLPSLTDDELLRIRSEALDRHDSPDHVCNPRWCSDEQYAANAVRWAIQDRDALRERLEEAVQATGEGVCATGAYRWYSLVKAGMDPAEAFAQLPVIFGDDDAYDPLDETAAMGVQAGMTYTLAWELAYRNDETYRRRTPEERWQAFIDWIDSELAAA